MKWKTLNKVMKATHAYKILLFFVIFVFLVSLAFMLLDPDTIHNYGEALWYSYVNLFTIGFGDIVVQNPIARILSVCLTIYATVVIALMTAVIVAWYQEYANREFKIEHSGDLKKLAHLEDYSKEDLKKLSQRLREGFHNIDDIVK